MLRRGLVACAAMLTLGAVVAHSADRPVLTDVAKLQIQQVTLQMQIAQLQAQVAERDYAAARTRLERLLAQTAQDGYVLDLTTLTYQPVAESGTP